MDEDAPREGDMLLQTDIEGHEYSVILDTPSTTLQRFRILVLELHALDQLFNKWMQPILIGALEKVLEDFVVVHLHPNNAAQVVTLGDLDIPTLMEVTLLRKDWFTEDKGVLLEFPHSLDEKNLPERPDLVLPKCWRT